MKAYILVCSLIILSMILVGCMPSGGSSWLPVFTPKLTAQATITQIEPTSIDAVRVYYDLKNTGNVTIDYYKIYFIAQCTDNSTITDWTYGSNVLPGTMVSDYTFFDTGNKTVSSIAVYKIYLKNYQYDLELYINP